MSDNATQWRMVPIEPTPEMITCGRSAGANIHLVRSVYAAMLAAAPTPPATSEGQDAVEAIDRRALMTKLDALIAAASREWGAGSTEHNLVRDISDAVARAPALTRAGGDGWRPIAEAPKDGTVIDVWRDGTRETVYWGFRPHECGEMGQYCDSDWHSEKEPGWVCSTFGEFVGGEYDPFTHFRPLPAAPDAEGR